MKAQTAQKALRILNPILGLAVLLQAVSALTAGAVPYATFVWLHVSGGVVLLALALAHLSLNWNWIKANYLKKRAGR